MTKNDEQGRVLILKRSPSVLGVTWTLVRQVDNRHEANGFLTPLEAEQWARDNGWKLA